MKTEVDESQAIGKTIKNFVYSGVSGQMIIDFDDDTFITFRALWDHYDELTDIENVPLDLFNFSKERLIESGIISKDEYEKMREKKHLEELANRRERDLAHYKVLKQRLGIE